MRRSPAYAPVIYPLDDSGRTPRSDPPRPPAAPATPAPAPRPTPASPSDVGGGSVGGGGGGGGGGELETWSCSKCTFANVVDVLCCEMCGHRPVGDEARPRPSPAPAPRPAPSPKPAGTGGAPTPPLKPGEEGVVSWEFEAEGTVVEARALRWEAGRWIPEGTGQETLIIAPAPFGKGHCREAWAALWLNEGTPKRMVLKTYIRPDFDVRGTYETDVQMQCEAIEYARQFNEQCAKSAAVPSGTLKSVSFVPATLLELGGWTKRVCAAEAWLPGAYRKHNSNFGYVDVEHDRNTPQAFSHYTYCQSRGEVIVVDVQGVDDMYTDPQFHTKSGAGYGVGNMGVEGMLKFFQTHRCNAVCRAIGLSPSHAVKTADYGTAVPVGRR